MGLNQYTFFGGGHNLDALIQKDDPLTELESYIDFEQFRPALEGFIHNKPAKGPGGRPRWDVVLMFKILVLQRIYNIGDERTEFRIRDSLSFHRFLGLQLGDKVPDSRTIWDFREQLTGGGQIEQLFNSFNQQLLDKGIITRQGPLVDASFVTVPKQRNTPQENKMIKEGKAPESWACQPRKLAQKDTDARWTIKGHQPYYGYKNHVSVDRDSKLILNCLVTAASYNDAKGLRGPVDGNDRCVHADSAYQTPFVRAYLRKLGIPGFIQVKGTRHVTLTDEQRRQNRLKSKVRCRVEHVFALIKNSLGGLHLRYINIERINSAIGLTNLIHNMVRLGQLRPHVA